MIDLDKVFQNSTCIEKDCFIHRPKRIIPSKKDNPSDPVGKRFEKRVWRLFYNFNAEILNAKKTKFGKHDLTFDLSASYGQGECSVKDQQIDNCFVVRDKYVFFIECKYRTKASSAPLLRDYQAKWKELKKPLEKRFKKLFGTTNSKGGKWTFIHVIATQGVNWNPCDLIDEDGETVEIDPIKVLKKEGFIVLTQNELSYFEKIYENSNSEFFTFNQFLGIFKTDQNFLIGKERSWTAFKTRIDPGKDGEYGTNDDIFAYTTSMKVKDLLNISTISHSKAIDIYKASDVIMGRYQRILKKKRLSRTSSKGVPWFIETYNKPFINNLLVNYRGKESLSDIFSKPEQEAQISSEGRGGLLKFPKLHPGMFQIMDGQHRLFGYAPLMQEDEDSEYGEHELIVTIFDNLKPEEEAEFFLNVNENQEGIDKGLVLDIKQLFGADGPAERVHSNLISTVIDNLNSKDGSPFLKPKAFKETENIKDVTKEGNIAIQGKLTKTGIHTVMKESKLFASIGNDIQTGLAYKEGSDKYESYKRTSENLINIYLYYFSLIKEANSSLWQKSNDAGQIVSNDEKIAQNIPIGGMLYLLDHFIASTTIKKGTTILKAINSNLEKLKKALANLSEQDEYDLFGDKTYGTSGPRAFFYTLLHKYFPKLITEDIREKVYSSKNKFLSKQGKLSTSAKSDIEENYRVHNKTQDVGSKSLANEAILVRLMDGFFRKIIGPNYWDEYITFEHPQAEANSKHWELLRYKQLKKDKRVKDPKKQLYTAKIYWNRWCDFRDILKKMYTHSGEQNEHLDTTFKESKQFQEEYGGSLKQLIKEIFFIIDKGDKTTNVNEQLVKWIEISDNVRDEPSHLRDEPYLTEFEREDFIKVDPEIHKIFDKLDKFIGI